MSEVCVPRITTVLGEGPTVALGAYADCLPRAVGFTGMGGKPTAGGGFGAPGVARLGRARIHRDRDWCIASEWDPGAKPVTRKLKYDDLYRLSKIEYQYSQGSDEWKDPFAVEVSDINRPQPSPRADFTGAKRPLWQTYAHDWLGNTVSTDDDAHGFYDRSLGVVDNEGYQLKEARNEDTNAVHRGNLRAQYDQAGNLIAMGVHREGPCLPANPPNSCTDQHFEYDWDEVGRLVRARRWDMANPDTIPPGEDTPNAELSYTYDASDNRVLKTVGNHYTAYIFGSLELHSTTFDGDYVVGPTTETVYLQGHGVRLARVVHEVDDPYELASTRVFLELGDQLGSTSVVLDLATGELVERSTAYAYGATESDYRPERWGKFREDYRFTGKEEDIEVGLQYFGKRFYAPLLQRWVSADPLAVHAPGQADLNLYAYVHGRVLVAVDPVGLDDDDSATLTFAAELLTDGVCDFLGCGDANAAAPGLDTPYNGTRVTDGARAVTVAAGAGLGVVLKRVAPRVVTGALDQVMVSSFTKRFGRVAAAELGRISKVLGRASANRLGAFVAATLTPRRQLHSVLRALAKNRDLPVATVRVLERVRNALEHNIKPEEIVGAVSQRIEGVGGHSAPRWTTGEVIDHAKELRNAFNAFQGAIDSLSGHLKHLENEAHVRGDWSQAMTREKEMTQGAITTMQNMQENVQHEIDAAAAVVGK